MRTITISRRRLILLLLLAVAIVVAVVVFAATGQSPAETPARATFTPEPTGGPPSPEQLQQQFQELLTRSPEEIALPDGLVLLVGRATCTGVSGDQVSLLLRTDSGREFTFTFSIGQVSVYRPADFFSQPGAWQQPTAEDPLAVLAGLEGTPVRLKYRADPLQVLTIMVLGGTP